MGVAMPVLELHLIEGYTGDDKRRLGEALTDAVRFIVPAQPDGIVVMIHEMKPDAYFRGRDTKTPAPSLPDPAKLVTRYLAAMEARELDQALSMLSDGFIMQFPGADPMTELSELIDWAAPRYQFVKKCYEGIEAMQSEGAAAVVYARGTLSGKWSNGTAFESIRFIDRFEVNGGMLTRQDVWNDVAEVKAQL